MYKYIFILLITFLSVNVTAQETIMNASEIAAFKKQVSAASISTNTLKSDFVQFKHLDFLSDEIKTSGKLFFKTPGLVKWEYTNPYQYSVIFKGDQLLINDGGTKSNVDIGNSKMFKNLNQLIVNSVKGNMFDDAEFNIKYLKTPKANKAIFVPKDKKIAAYIASFELLFDKKDAAVLEVKMIEPSADYTRIVFSNRILNGTVNDAVFKN